VNRETPRGIGGVVIFLAVWEAAVSTKLVDFDYLPAPSVIAAALVGMAQDGEVFGEIVHTLQAALVGWLISIVIGGVAGAALGLSPVARKYCLATVEALRPLPGIAFVPVAILVFGFSLQPELVVIVIPTVWPILVNTMGGFAAIPSRLHDVVRSFRMSPMAATLTIFAPATAPAILVGLRLSMTLALIMAIAVEMIGNPEGLGYAVVREAAALRPDVMFAYVFIIGVLGIVLNALLIGAAKLVLPGEFKRPRAEWSRT
jgi:sulfonate transport system permease protein